MRLIQDLAAHGGPRELSVPVAALGEEGSALLTTAQAAARLDVSRPYVSALCDAGKLGPVTTTEGGHRRIARSAVEAYRISRLSSTPLPLTPREAGIGANLYDRPDSEYRFSRHPRSAAKAARK